MRKLAALAFALSSLALFAERETAIYRGKLTSDLNANGNRVTNAAPPVADGDLVNKAYVDSVATNGIRSVDGAARPLPKYLHALNFDDSYPDEAEEYYRSRGNGKTDGGCSSVRDGGFLYRNFDFPFDDRAEFIVRVSSRGGDIPVAEKRYASVGVAQVGTNLTEAIVTSGKPSRCYKWLPGATVDGINENGVACNINVVDGDPQTSGWHTTGDLHPLAAIRWILDHATNAQHGAEYIAANIHFPAGWTQNFHYMVADETFTYIVENGDCYRAGLYDLVKPILTNFRVVGMQDGSGTERYNILLDGGNITNAWYTNAYRRETTPPWVSDLAEVIAYTNEIFDAWATHPKEYFRNSSLIPHTSSLTWWQSVHTSVYDLTNRTLRIAVQETDDWYVFAVDQANVDLSPIEAQIAELQSGKRDKTDIAVYPKVWTASGMPSDARIIYGPTHDESHWNLTTVDSVGEVNWYANGLPNATVIDQWFQHTGLPRPWDLTLKCDVFAKKSQLDEKVDAVPGKGLSQNDYTDADKAEVAKVKDKADEFSAWVLTYVPPSEDIENFRVFDTHTDNILFLQHKDADPDVPGRIVWTDVGVGQYNEWDLSLDIISYGNLFTATRKRVLRTGDAATPQELTNAISTNNPAFVSAVRNTPTSGMPEDMPTDWGTYGTVGAALAALAAFVKWAKAKIVAVIGDDGKPTDTFATDLIGKPVAISAMQDIIADDVIPVTGDTSLTKTIATIGGKAIKAPEGGGGDVFHIDDGGIYVMAKIDEEN